MNLDKTSLAYRLLVPLFAVIAAVSVTLLLVVARISENIVDGYYRSTLAAYCNETNSLLGSALAELSTARLLGNKTVTEAKQRTVLEALKLNWKTRMIDGVVTGPGGMVLFSSLPRGQAAEVARGPMNEMFRVRGRGSDLRGEGFLFAPWNWKIYLVTTGLPDKAERREALYLAPLVAFGAFVMMSALYLVLQRRLRTPVASMVDSLHAEQEIGPTGVSEFDRIGGAVNEALRRVKERTETVLQKEQQIQLLLDSTAEGIYGIDMNGDCTFCNAASLSLLGYGHQDELLGRNMHTLIHHAHADGRPYPHQECAIYSAYRMRREVHVDDEVFWRKDGSPMPVEYWSYPVVKHGQVVGAVVTFVDISARRRQEAELLQERNKFEAIIAALGDAMSIQDRNYRVLYQNNVHRRLRGDCIGKLCYEAYMQNAEVCPGCQLALAFADGGVHTLERRAQIQDEERHFEITASPLRDASGSIVAGIELVRDITGRKRTEAQLRQAQKMEAVGTLAGGIAHDFNNVLSAIIGYTSLVKKHQAPGSEPYLYTEQILRAAERATRLCRQILAFSRKQILNTRPVAVNQIVHDIAPLMTRLLGEDIEVRTDLAERDMTIMADSSQIEQVLMNLATNARDAMPRGGTLTIRTGLSGDGTLPGPGQDQPQGCAVISVSDTGAGMDEQTKAKIFEPFFTTKDPGKGTGLGLAIVYSIIRQHNGRVSVSSAPGRGTTFSIEIPLAPGAAESKRRESAREVPGGTETILLAEDDAAVSNVLKISLEEHGYRVIEARDGEEAVLKFSAHAGDIRLCLFDVIMPKMNGKEAFLRISGKHRDAPPVIFMSGYTADAIEADDLRRHAAAFLSKPVFPPDLLPLVREVLDRR